VDYLPGVLMDKIQIRNSEEEDFLVISQIASKCSPMVTERDSIYHIFTKFFQNTVFLAEKLENGNNIAIGFLIGFISQSNSDESYIHLLCVDPKFRGRKIASNLIKKFCDAVSQNGCKKVYLITKPINQRAINFYQKSGFRICTDSKIINIRGMDVFKDYDGFGEHMVVFQKDLIVN
jgi:ribosomal protein S18 acetylase RimI-like enzyme